MEEKEELKNDDSVVNNENTTVENQENVEVSNEEIIEKLNADLEEQKARTDEYFEHLKRNMAEFDNYKKRIAKEKESMYKTIVSDIVEDLLPIMDNFEQALNAECKDDKYKDGISMIYNQFTDFLRSQGLEEIEDLGKTFDPNLHEAVMHEEIEDKGEKEIVEVFRKGYKIGEKVIRHSMVKVAN